MLRRWVFFPENKNLQRELSKALNISPLTAQVLINRKILSPEQAHIFYNSDLSTLPSPFLLKGMKEAVERIRRAIRIKERIMVYGDYDADGITGTALLFSVLRRLGADVCYYIPNRLTEGYGLNIEALQKAKRKGVALLITVDCGINAHKEVNYAHSLGIEIIITDHHRLDKEPPPALAVINPLQPECSYPGKELTGVGLAYKMACALTGEREEENLDLVALGTVADIAPLVGENRVLVKEGLKRIGERRVGLKALMRVAGLKGEVGVGSIGYILGPRINASGRLSSPYSALKILLTSSAEEAEELAHILNEENIRRQKVEKEILEEATKKLISDKEGMKKRIIVLSDRGWHQGVIGIVAARLVERYYRPVILITIREDKGKGSGRSIKNFHLFDALSQCKGILETYGGHRYAIGLSLPAQRIEEFKREMERIADALLSEEDLIPEINIDAHISLAELNFSLLQELAELSPFGWGNPKPVFASTVRLRSYQRLRNSHLKIWVNDDKITYPALWFNEGERFSPPKGEFQVAYSPVVNIWEGRKEIQLVVKDIKIKEGEG
ncbi:MAG: single-stranded-DNA-specific exonuclease RecJ [Candidatus Omnitrophota bacterium]|nr:MAG: single-stranded-DNA-specific exonuclease RecJ [Candidatus Omnitrophota bacterium]